MLLPGEPGNQFHPEPGVWVWFLPAVPLLPQASRSTRNCPPGWEQSKQGRRSEGFVLSKTKPTCAAYLPLRHQCHCIRSPRIKPLFLFFPFFNKELHKSMTYTPSNRENRTHWSWGVRLPGHEAFSREVMGTSSFCNPKVMFHGSRKPEAKQGG